MTHVDPDRVTREVFPTKSFSMPKGHGDWLDDVAAQIGKNKRSRFLSALITVARRKPEYVNEAIALVMDEDEKEAA